MREPSRHATKMMSAKQAKFAEPHWLVLAAMTRLLHRWRLRKRMTVYKVGVARPNEAAGAVAEARKNCTVHITAAKITHTQNQIGYASPSMHAHSLRGHANNKTQIASPIPRPMDANLTCRLPTRVSLCRLRPWQTKTQMASDTFPFGGRMQYNSTPTRILREVCTSTKPHS